MAFAEGFEGDFALFRPQNKLTELGGVVENRFAGAHGFEVDEEGANGFFPGCGGKICVQLR
ncbi:MAG: hypothetical protein NT023_19200 [Armatimonadetes bacterium]|nr:hypothetical protein [Armatimonadota bacterium]